MAQSIKMELLSPAGSMESLVAAVQNGADAVYFGGAAFSARRNAKNFDNAALVEALDYCHVRGVKAYITLNTLIFDRELAKALDYAGFLYEQGADALIVQDIGLISLLRSQLPGMPLHASTQMGIHDEGGARLAERLGMQCVVLAREVPLSRIRAIKDAANIRLEAFAHGAMCMSFSGGCLFSSMAGERSGNRGTCAQPCRKRMAVGTLPGGADYALSLGDICMLEHLGKMQQAGVGSIKLEGRMKRAEYVALVTRAYRQALDGEPVDIGAFKAAQSCVFNRGFTTGHYYPAGASTGFVAQQGAGAPAIEAGERRCAIELEMELAVGQPARLVARCGGVSAEVSGAQAQPANKPQDASMYAEKLKKLGGTPFYCTKCRVQAGAFLPVAGVNELRRQAVRQLEQELCLRHRRAKPELSLKVPAPIRAVAEPLGLVAVARNADQAIAAKEFCSHVALDFCRMEQAAGMPGGMLLYLPPVMLSPKEREKAKTLLASGAFVGAVANNIGQLELMDGQRVRIAGAHLNAFNAQAVLALRELGCTHVQLSLELTRPQLRDIIASAGGGACAYGCAPLMLLRHCPVKEKQGCQGCQGRAGELVDEAGRRFPLVNNRQEDGCLVRLLNCDVTDVTDLAGELSPEFWVLEFFEESPEKVRQKLKSALAAIEGRPQPAPGGTRGHWRRAVD